MAPLFLRPLLVPTTVESYYDTHTRTLANPHAEAPFVAVTVGNASSVAVVPGKRGCCIVTALAFDGCGGTSKTAAEK